MYTGTLNVVTLDMANNTSPPLWSVSGDQGDKWQQAFVTIGNGQTIDYAVLITASISTPVTSDISIDDIKTTAGACTGQPSTS